MGKIRTKFVESDEMKKRYEMTLELHRTLKRNSGGAIVLLQNNKNWEYDAFFEDAAIVSELAHLPIVLDIGFIRCPVGKFTMPIIEAIVNDGRKVAVIEDGEPGKFRKFMYTPENIAEWKQSKGLVSV